MKKNIFFLVLVSFVIAGLYVSIGYGHKNSAPNLECISCHEGEMVQNMVKVQGLPKNYVPGKTYNLTVVVTSDLESMSECKGGFAIEASAGKLIVKDKKNTQLSNGILTHTQEGSELRKWNFSWKAPSEKTDANITVMAVAANGDYSPFGDKVGAGSYIIKSTK
ncbi:choice-of-anchor V domain-containing protein [Dissulfurispira sp.]|uniref:choice-of-anchor V domain-containing protein n=1 Tax=Dissulfurispira sp. TaxID=2817609 RepID=UPI002FDABC31